MRKSDFRFHTDAGSLCLNCAATKGLRGPQEFDRWSHAEDLSDWLRLMGLFEPGPIVGEEDLERAREVREAVYGVVKARSDGKTPPAADVATLNRFAAMPGLSKQLSSDDWSAYSASGQPVARALGTIASDAIDLVTGPYGHRIRQCEAHDCTVFFVDTSRPGKRRWCSMNRCGNKQKKRVFHERHSE